MILAVFTILTLVVDTSSVDSTGHSSQEITEVTDPASNRLFWMSTGRTGESQSGSIGLLGAPYLMPWAPVLTFLQAGYAPTGFLQMNLTGSIGYWSVGTKVQMVPSIGILRGVAVGADFGFYPGNIGIVSDTRVSTYNLATSVGWKSIEAHANAMQVVQSRSNQHEKFPTFLQFGLALQLSRSALGGGSKLMTELWYVNDYRQEHLEFGLMLVGIRTYRSHFVWEIAFIVGPKLSTSNDPQFIPLPYLSFMWFF